MTRQRQGSMTEAGIAIAILGLIVWVLIKFALSMSGLIMFLAGWAIIIGVVVAIIGAVTNRR